MTREQTRQLAIEFERRILIMYPQSEYIDKLNTETIFSILNEYLIKYLTLVLMTLDLIESNTESSIKLNLIFRSLVSHYRTDYIPERNTDNEINTAVFKLPDDFFYYIRSVSIIDSNYKHPDEMLDHHETVVNIPIKTSDANNILETSFNKGLIIRQPYVVLEQNENKESCIKVFSDGYTSIDAVDITYCKTPHIFSPLGFNDDSIDPNAIHSYCDLPYECFNDIVDGAVSLYINNYKFYISIAANDRTRKSIEKAIGEMADSNKNNTK